MANNNGLGRGLGSLIPDKNERQSQGAPSPSAQADGGQGQVWEIEVEKIAANPNQPRHNFDGPKMDELVESIKKHGVIQPLVATKKGDKYELIAGERRLRASKEAGLKKVPVIVRRVDDQEKLEMALIENIQRQDLNPIELGHGYRRLIDEFNMSQEEVAKQVGKGRPTVTNTLRMLSLPEEIQAALTAGKIGEGHAKYLLGLADEKKQMTVFNKIIRNKMTITDTDKLIKQMGGTKNARIKINYRDKDKEFAFREFFGTKVEIRRKGKGGQVIIDFFSDDELEEIVGKVKK